MNNGTHGQRGIMVNTDNRDGAPWGWGTWAMEHMSKGVSWLILKIDGAPWGMGHMGDGANGQWGTWSTCGHVHLS